MIEIWDRAKRHAVRTGFSDYDQGGVVRSTYCRRPVLGSEVRRVSLRNISLKEARIFHIDCLRCVEALECIAADAAYAREHGGV